MTALALDLDHAGIRLLAPEGNGWRSLGTVALDAADVPAEMRALRQVAEQAAPGRVETTLVIPRSQILYTEIAAPHGAPLRDADIRRALAGRTPCPAEELMFDWRWEGDRIRVAALDVTTLDEAEEFAVTYGFNPIRFTARPTRGEFPEPPDFGPTQFVRHRAIEDGAIFASRRDRLGLAAAAGTSAEPASVAVAADRRGRRPAAAPRSRPATAARGLSRQSLVTAGTAVVTATAMVLGASLFLRPATLDSFLADDAVADAAASVTAPTDDPAVRVVAAAQAGARPAPDAPKKTSARPAPAGVMGRPADAAAAPPEEAAADPAAAELPPMPVLPDPPRPVGLPLAPLAPADASDAPVVFAALEVGPEGAWSGIGAIALPAPDPAREVPDPDALAADRVAQTPPPPLSDPVIEAEGYLYLAALDPRMTLGDAVALDTPPRRDSAFRPGPPPRPAGGAETDSTRRGREPAVAATRDDPEPTPATGPDDAEPVNPVFTSLEGRTPRVRPDGLVERRERSLLGGLTRSELAAIRVHPRPPSAQQTAMARREATAGASTLAIAVSSLPRPRPDEMSVIVATARAASAVASTAAAPPAVVVAVAPTTPILPSTASVSKRATQSDAIDLSRVNLIGVYGGAGDRRALIRLPSGRFVKVGVGDRVDGGQVAGIGDGELRYVKGGRNLTLKVPSG